MSSINIRSNLSINISKTISSTLGRQSVDPFTERSATTVWYQIVSDLSDRIRLYQMVSECIRSYQMVSDGIKWYQMVIKWVSKSTNVLHLIVNQTVQLDGITLLCHNSRARSTGSTCSVTTREHTIKNGSTCSVTTREHTIKNGSTCSVTTREHNQMVPLAP